MKFSRPIFIVLIILATLFLVFFFVIPEYQVFSGLQTQLVEKTAQYNAANSYYNAITQTYTNLQAHQSDLTKIDSALPANSDVGGLIYFLQGAATTNGLLTQNLFLSTPAASTPTSPANTIKNIVFLMSVSGDYASLQKFITTLEQSSRLFEITSISFGGSTQTQKSTNFSLQIVTHSY